MPILSDRFNRVRSSVRTLASSAHSAPIEASKAQPSVEPIAGRVLLASGEEMACTTVMSSPQSGEVRIKAKIDVRNVLKCEKDEAVICALDNVGILVGRITGKLSDGFTVAFKIKDNRQEKVAARLEWHAVEAGRAANLRGAPRIVPIHRSVAVGITENLVIDGTILNISLSGAAIALTPDHGLFIGTLVRVGRRMATVVRGITDGVAVQFVEPFTPDNFDERVRP